MKRFFLLSLFVVALFLALTFFRKSEPFFPRLGSPQLPSQDLERLLEKSDSILQKNPNDLSALVDKGVVYYAMGPDHYSESLNTLNAAWRQGAFDKREFYYLGLLYENLSLFDEAEKQYERYLKHESNDREIKLRLARLLFRMGKWQECINQYEGLVQENPNDVTSLINLGLAYQKKFEAESEVKGKNKLSTAQIQEFPAQGAAYLEKAAAIDPNLAKGIYLALAKMLAAQGRWDQAAVSAQAELDKYSLEGGKAPLEILAQCYEKLNEKPKLMETYQKLLELDPKNSHLKRKINALKKSLGIK